MKFVKDNLTEINALSIELLNLIDFKSGAFFTLLPEGSDLERLHEFKYGVILPQNSLIITERKKSFSREVPTIKKEMSSFIFNKLTSNPILSCIFDDVISYPDDLILNYFYEKKSIYLHENKVIYVIRKNNIDRDFLLKCIWNSFSSWHSAGVLTEADCFETDNNILSLEDIRSICIKATMVLVSAYDGEGYVYGKKISRLKRITGKASQKNEKII